MAKNVKVNDPSIPARKLVSDNAFSLTKGLSRPVITTMADRIIVEIPRINPATPSASGKSMVVASTYGNVVAGELEDGTPLTLGLNVYFRA